MLPSWMEATIGTLTIVSLLMVIWAKGIRPMMRALGTLLDTDDKLEKHLKDSQHVWNETRKRLDRIEKKIDQNGHS